MVRRRSLPSALERRKAVAALLALLEYGPLGATELTERIEGHSRKGILIAQHLEKHGLVEIKKRPGKANRPAYVIRLSNTGRLLAKGLENLERHLSGARRRLA